MSPSSPPPLVIRPGQDCVLAFQPGSADDFPWIYFLRRRTAAGWTTSFIYIYDIDAFIPTEEHIFIRHKVLNYLRIWLDEVWMDPSWKDVDVTMTDSGIDIQRHLYDRRDPAIVPIASEKAAVLVDVVNLGLVADVIDRVAEFTTMFAGREARARFLPFYHQRGALQSELKAISFLEQKGGGSLVPKILAYVYAEEESNVVGSILDIKVSRAPTIADLEVCKSALEQLHACGIVHGNLEFNMEMTDGGPVFLDFGSAQFRGDSERWSEAAKAECDTLHKLQMFHKPRVPRSSSAKPNNIRPTSMIAPKYSRQHIPTPTSLDVPINELPMTRSGQLRDRAKVFCDAFTVLASNPPEKILDSHFGSQPKITEHGPRSDSDIHISPQSRLRDTKLPFLGKTFSGRDECLEYFRLLADTLEFEPNKSTFPNTNCFVVDADAVGPDECAPQPGFGGQGVVCVVGNGLFRSVTTGTAWTESFIYRLSGFDDRGRIGHWESKWRFLFQVLTFLKH